jgi:predicted nucleotidyltransferase
VPDFEAFLDRARSDDNVVGVVLSGSRGRAELVSERSDWDAFVVIREVRAAIRRSEAGSIAPR